MMFALLLRLSAHDAFAGTREEAEHQRLASEIASLAQRQQWAGVEKKYQEIERLGIALTFDDLLRGAYAARALGNVSAAYARLKEAAKLNGTKEVVDWLYTIDATYGNVELSATPPKGVELAVSEIPFDPDARIAVEAAINKVKATGVFEGMLPRGSYTYAGQQFSVEPGIAVRIEVSPRLKKTQGEVVNVTTNPTWTQQAPPTDPAAPPPEPTPPPEPAPLPTPDPETPAPP